MFFPPLAALPPEVEMLRGGGDLRPETLLTAYRAGYFPMPVQRKIGWFSPDPRGIIDPTNLRVPRSLRRSARNYEIRLNTSFLEVIRACGDPARPHGWIDRNIVEAYTRLHYEGIAHSVEAWDDHGLAGGLYGLSIGGFFAGESMFHRRTDASKVALMGLAEIMSTVPGSLIDTQWNTDHLERLGAFDIPRSVYADLLTHATALPTPNVFNEQRMIIRDYEGSR